MDIQRIDFLGLPLDTGVQAADVCKLLRYKDVLRLVTFINPAAWAIARRSPGYAPALEAMSLVLPDGEGVARVCRWLTRRDCPRLSFDTSSLAGNFSRAAAIDQASVALIGGKPGVDEDLHRKLQQVWPDLKITMTAHGYGDFGPKIDAIFAAGVNVVVVGMGAPRQEDFLLALRDTGYRGMAITCGGFFDQYLEADQYYPAWIDRWNLRFAWRLYKEPRRLWRRYLIDYQFFVWRALKALAETYTPAPLQRAVAAMWTRLRGR